MMISACAYGVPRAQCHVGCGRTCRRIKDTRPDTPCCVGCDKPAGHAPCRVGYIGSDRAPGVGPYHA